MTKNYEITVDQQNELKDVINLLQSSNQDQLLHAMYPLAYSFVDAAEPELSEQDKWYKSILMIRYSVENSGDSALHSTVSLQC